MRTSKNGIELIKKFEGFRPKAYLCPANVLTIGYGHTANVKVGDVIKEHEAALWLAMDIRLIEIDIENLNLSINQNQFDAIVSFCYNVGFGAFSKSGLLREIKLRPNSTKIPFEFRKWNKANRKVQNGLKQRREEEIKLYQKL